MNNKRKFAILHCGRVLRVVEGPPEMEFQPNVVPLDDGIADNVAKRPHEWMFDKRQKAIVGVGSKGGSVKDEIKARLKTDLKNLMIVETLALTFKHPGFLAYRQQWRNYMKQSVKAMRRRRLEDLPEKPRNILEVLLDTDEELEDET